MQMKCPHCSALFDVEVVAKSEYSREQEKIINQFFDWLKGIKPYKGYFKQINAHEFEYCIQTYDSPEGDVWDSGIIVWTPGCKLEFKKKEERGT